MARLLAFFLLLVAALPAAAQTVSERNGPGAVALVSGGKPGAILVDPADDAGVLRAAHDLAADFGRVTGTEARLANVADTVVIAGTVGKSALVDRLARTGKLDLGGVTGRWEAYVHQVVEHPLPGVARALVIAGADRRGTIFGIYDLSQRIGVSPWYWWADVAPRRHAALYVLPGRRVEAPAVRYRGIFLNDEEPALGGWARKTFGGLNHKFYERVFELILRQRGNLLWPAMWGKSFFEDDPANARLANEMGVAISTSHHEPLMRAQQDWHTHNGGAWDYTQNAERLRAFWREGVERTNGMDRLVTIGMRGDGDEPMAQGTATKLLETIVADQRRIISEATGRPAAETPQVWALYKEVQDYYDACMRVPDDVTLLFSDDNWGNIRRLPEPGERRAGGYGVYYHFDYVGDPRNYKWIDTIQLGRVAEQMRLAYDHGARQLWIANVGDLKPLELPTSFFLDYAWNPDAWPVDRNVDYASAWAARQFGPVHAREIGGILTRYGNLAARRKPELLAPDTYTLDEWDRVAGEWEALEFDAETIGHSLPSRDRDSYLELVLHKAMAFANLHALYRSVAYNRVHAADHLGDAMLFADEARRRFARDGALRALYESAAGGKWAGMLAQTHIGYAGWQQPDRDVMPELKTLAGPGKRASPPAPPVWNAVAVDAAHFAKAQPAAGLAWRTIPNLGHSGAAVAAFPMIATAPAPGSGPRLDYVVSFPTPGDVTLEVQAAPDLDVSGQGRLRYAIAIDEDAPQAVNLLAGETAASWAKAVAENVRRGTTRHHVARAGRHVVHIWVVDPQVVFERIVAAWGPLPPTYLGPPEKRP